MAQYNTSRWCALFILALLFLQSGCASRIPKSLPLHESERPFVLDQLQEFQSRTCSQSLDADVTLEWQMLGKTEKIPGQLQLQAPSFLRYSVVDPLGRQLLILVSDGNSFTLVDNRKAKALTGQVDSEFWLEYIPGFIAPQEYTSWLTGRLPEDDFTVKEIRRDMNSGEAVWLITPWRSSIRHHVLFYPGSGQITHHIVEGENNEILLDIEYADYNSNGGSCAKPHLLMVQGSDISGTIKVHFDEIFPETSIPETIFNLTLPDHFTVNTVE